MTSRLPTDVYAAYSVRRIDQAAISSAGVSGYALMTRAGQYAFDLAQRKYPAAAHWQVICGGGNNAGDGYVVARLALEQGIAVSVLALSSPDALSGDAATAYRDYAAAGGRIVGHAGELDAAAELQIDALLGSGLQRDVSGDYANAVAAINAHPALVVALDIPTGLHADTGQIMGVAVSADLTVTFVGLKPGLFLQDAPEYVGALAFSGLDIPDRCRAEETPVLRLANDALVRAALPKRRRNAHKGDFGRVLVVGGAPGMPGAVRLCGEAALRAGAGAVEIATHPQHSATISAVRPELMCTAVASAKELEPLVEKADVVAIGPGLGTGAWSQALLEVVLAGPGPIVVDADALNLIAGSDVSRDDWILTPHPGEAGRLLGTQSAAVQADRFGAAQALLASYGGTVILKGSGTLLARASEVPWLCRAGNPGMASPGMGDALAGIVAAMLAQGVSLEMSAVVGTQIHARAGDAAARNGERGLLASDLIEQIRAVVNQ